MKYLLLLYLMSRPEMVHAENGQTLFSNNCVVCHGEKGLGDGPAASSMNPRPRNLAKDVFKNGDSIEAIANTLEKGLNQMPSFSWLSEADRLALANYVKGLRK